MQSAPPPTFRIEPPADWPKIRWVELWRYRELLYFLAWRDVKIRYKQTVLGMIWAAGQPLTLTLVFALFAGRLAGIPSNGLPYPLFAFSGLLLWQLFSHALTNASNSLVTNERLITKVYFPRLLLPLASIIVGFFDFGVGAVILVGMLVFYSVEITLAILWLPAFIILTSLTAFAVAVWLSALNAQYRDVRHTLPFLAQLWLFATPIAYPASLAPAEWRHLLGLNPMAGIVEGFRWSLAGGGEPPGPMLGVSAVTIVVLLFGGMLFFRKTEAVLADVI